MPVKTLEILLKVMREQLPQKDINHSIFLLLGDQ
jgi:hypothetical protein